MNQKNLVLRVFGEGNWQEREKKIRKRNRNITIIDGGLGTVYFEVYVKDNPGLNNGFLEVEPGLYRIPDIYKTNHFLSDYKIPEDSCEWFYNLDSILPSEKEILEKYLKIYKDGWEEPEMILGFMPRRDYKGAIYIQPDGPLSDVYILSKTELQEIDRVNINPLNLDYRRSDYILPGKLNLYPYMYKLPGQHRYLGTHSNNQIIWQS
jgi:hypothetical protein